MWRGGWSSGGRRGVDDAGVDVLGMVEAGCVVVGEAVRFVW